MADECRNALRSVLRGFLSEEEVALFRDADLDILLRERYETPAAFQRCTKEDLREIGVPMGLVRLLLPRPGKLTGGMISQRHYCMTNCPLRPGIKTHAMPACMHASVHMSCGPVWAPFSSGIDHFLPGISCIKHSLPGGPPGGWVRRQILTSLRSSYTFRPTCRDGRRRQRWRSCR